VAARVHGALGTGQVPITHVITARIQERKPDTPTYEVYELLDKILADYDLEHSLDMCIDASVATRSDSVTVVFDALWLQNVSPQQALTFYAYRSQHN
jgi:hypothetical protein